MNFQVGDIVECVRDNGLTSATIYKGRTYTITHIDGDYLWLDIEMGRGGWSSDRFILAEPAASLKDYEELFL